MTFLFKSDLPFRRYTELERKIQINTSPLKNQGNSPLLLLLKLAHTPNVSCANAIRLRWIWRYIPHLSRIHPAFDPHLFPLINKREYIGDICVYTAGKTEQAIADCTLSQYLQVEVRHDQ